jgi:nonspecific dipeptidase
MLHFRFFCIRNQVLTTYIHEIGKLVGPKPSSCRCLPPTPEALAVVGAFAKGFRCKCEI